MKNWDFIYKIEPNVYICTNNIKTRMVSTLIHGFYLLKPVPEKKILYIQIRGIWKEKNIDYFSNYLDDIEKAGNEMGDNFFVLADLRYMKPISAKIAKLHSDAQILLRKKGLIGTAEVIISNPLLDISLNRCSQNSGMPRKVFTSLEEGYHWIEIMQQKLL